MFDAQARLAGNQPPRAPRLRALPAAVVFALVAASLQSQAPPAFPGAEGFGATASGGRGGRVLYVTNLAAEGPGSLQHALDQTGPRYILFKVSGLIDAPVQLTTDDVTIAGQTSPGGIVIRGFHTTEEPYCDQDPGCLATARTAQNWILRHVRLRPGDDGGGLDDGLRLLHTQRAIVDHVSVANATDEAVQISYSHDITIQKSLLAETLGDHAERGGMLLNYSQPAQGYALDRLSLHHNLWDRIVGRMPEISRESTTAANTVMDLELSNNLLWDPGYFIDVTSETFPYGPEPSAPVWYHLNWVGNAAVARSGFPYGMIHFPEPQEPNQTSTYWGDNRFNLYPGRADYQLNYCCDDYPTATPPAGTPPWARTSRHPFPSITYVPSSGLLEWMRANVGAFPRDPMDRRLLAPLTSGTFDPAPRDQNPYGDAYRFDFAPSSPPSPPVDGDADGMPDAWESAHGLDPGVQDHNGTQLSVALTGLSGYTNLECYLNELADALVSGGGGGGGGTPCAADDTTLCLHGNRFRVRASWRTAQGQSGTAHVQPLTDDAGYLWFFAAENVEVLLKIVDACSFNQRFWVFSAGLTDVRVDLTVEDTTAGRTRSYVNPLGHPFTPVFDSDAFATCP